MSRAPLTPNLPEGPAPGAKYVGPASHNMKTLTIMLEENSDIPPNGLFVSLNGKGFMLKTSLWLKVPVPVLEVLDHAVSSVPKVDTVSGQVVGWRDKMRYPYRIAPGQTDPRPSLGSEPETEAA